MTRPLGRRGNTSCVRGQGVGKKKKTKREREREVGGTAGKGWKGEAQKWRWRKEEEHLARRAYLQGREQNLSETSCCVSFSAEDVVLPCGANGGSMCVRSEVMVHISTPQRGFITLSFMA